MASPNPTQSIDPALERAMKDASKELLHVVLTRIFLGHPDAISTASNFLLVEETAESETAESETDESETDESETEILDEEPDAGERPTKKRKRFELCTQCKEEYDVLANDEEGCNWHTGVYLSCMYMFPSANHNAGHLEVNDESSTWDDWDSNIGGSRDDTETVEEYPQGYIWSCCEKRGDDEDDSGCQVGPHSATRKVKKIGRGPRNKYWR
jgi:hypothetical protein